MAYGTVNADVIGTSVAGSNLGAGDASTMKNRIINGAMVISQRNGTSTVNPANADVTLDRWGSNMYPNASKYTVAQSTTAPAGFNNSLLVTSSSAYSIGATDIYTQFQWIEGYNTADLGWGTANAKTVTLSFWVRSSLTGSFGGVIANADGTRNYPFSYTISSANTWEYKTITIAGDTSGTWLTTNGRGIGVIFGLGVGSTYSGTAGAWSGSAYYSSTGATSVVGTNGATFYITGVQLEVGSSATGFEYRQYGTEFVLCQRYYQKSYPYATLAGASVGNSAIQNSWGTPGAGICGNAIVLPTTMRASPTLVVYDVVGNAARVSIYDFGAGETNNIPLNTSNADSQRLMVRIFGYSASGMSFMYTVSAEL
jgi:hypothetical protein